MSVRNSQGRSHAAHSLVRGSVTTLCSIVCRFLEHNLLVVEGSSLAVGIHAARGEIFMCVMLAGGSAGDGHDVIWEGWGGCRTRQNKADQTSSGERRSSYLSKLGFPAWERADPVRVARYWCQVEQWQAWRPDSTKSVVRTRDSGVPGSTAADCGKSPPVSSGCDFPRHFLHLRAYSA